MVKLISSADGVWLATDYWHSLQFQYTLKLFPKISLEGISFIVLPFSLWMDHVWAVPQNTKDILGKRRICLDRYKTLWGWFTLSERLHFCEKFITSIKMFRKNKMDWESSEQGSQCYSTHADFLKMYHKDRIVARIEQVVLTARTVSIRMRYV